MREVEDSNEKCMKVLVGNKLDLEDSRVIPK